MNQAELESQVEWFLANRVSADDLRELTIYMCDRTIDQFAAECRLLEGDALMAHLGDNEASADFKKRMNDEAIPVMAVWLRNKGYEIVLPDALKG